MSVRRTNPLVVVPMAVGLLALAGRSVQADPFDSDRQTSPPRKERHAARDVAPAFLGVSTEDDGRGRGARVTLVVPESAADDAGLREDDLIVGFEGRTIHSPATLAQAIRQTEPGERVTIELLRDGERETIEATMGEPARRNLRPLLGVQLVEPTPELRDHLGGSADRGVIVAKVVRDSAAAEAGVEVGDLIESLDGEPVHDAGTLIELVREHAGERVTLGIVRDRRSSDLDVELARPHSGR